jgi:hypothetical protein
MSVSSQQGTSASGTSCDHEVRREDQRKETDGGLHRATVGIHDEPNVSYPIYLQRCARSRETGQLGTSGELRVPIDESMPGDVT